MSKQINFTEGPTMKYNNDPSCCKIEKPNIIPKGQGSPSIQKCKCEEAKDGRHSNQ